MCVYKGTITLSYKNFVFIVDFLMTQTLDWYHSVSTSWLYFKHIETSAYVSGFEELTSSTMANLTKKSSSQEQWYAIF